MSEKVRIVVDVEQRRPGCVLLQAGGGCDRGRALVAQHFNTETWLLSPTPNMRVVEGTEEQILAFARECNSRHGVNP